MGDGTKNFREFSRENPCNTQKKAKSTHWPWLHESRSPERQGPPQPHEESKTTEAFNRQNSLYSFDMSIFGSSGFTHNLDLMPDLLNPSTSDSWQLPRWSESDRPINDQGDPTDTLLLRTREGRGNTVPENFHNRPLLPTTGEENNCAIDAIAISSNPNLNTTERKAIITRVRNTLVQEGYVQSGEQIDLNKDTNKNKLLGQVLLEIMSEQGHIEKNCGLMVHSSHYSEIIGDQHQVVDGDKQIHIYLEDSQPVQHFWGMGPEIE